MEFLKLKKEVERMLNEIEFGSIQIDLTIHNKEVSKIMMSKTEKKVLQGVRNE